jgi:hypothetical protein
MDLIREFKLPEAQKLTENNIRSIYSRISSTSGAVVGAFQNNVMVGTCTVNICANLSCSGRPYSIIENMIVTKKLRAKELGNICCYFLNISQPAKTVTKLPL